MKKNVIVSELFTWYFDLFTFDHFTADLMEDCDFAWELVDNGTFEDYQAMAKFIKEHKNDEVELKQTPYTDMFNQEYTIGGVKFQVDSLYEF